jgi:predicted negative regulator of RcsB-dependent stress response
LISACVFRINTKHCHFIMQAQDAATAYFLKSWSWVETNIRTVIAGAAVVIVVAILLSYYFWQQNETEVAAGQALTQMLVSTAPDLDAAQLADAYLKIATEYAGTPAGDRALMLGAAALFSNGKYPEAQLEFQKYLSAHPTGTYSATAALGIAASLDAQGKTDAAADAYQRVINGFSDPNAVDAAKFALAKIDEQRGQLQYAETFYQDVARDNPNSPLGSEAALHAIQLRSKLSAAPTSSPSAPFNLSVHP